MNRILERRLELGMTRREFARRAEVTYAMAYRWEKGAMPKSERRVKIAEILFTTVKRLFPKSLQKSTH